MVITENTLPRLLEHSFCMGLNILKLKLNSRYHGAKGESHFQESWYSTQPSKFFDSSLRCKSSRDHAKSNEARLSFTFPPWNVDNVCIYEAVRSFQQTLKRCGSFPPEPII